MRKLLILPLLFFSALVFAADIKAQEVKGFLKSKIVKKGESGKGKIILELPENVHANSAEPKTEYAIPANLTLVSPNLKFSKIKYPPGTDKKFEFSETVINVYENRVEFPFTYFVPKNFRGKNVTIIAKLIYQACTTEVCYEPRSEVVKLTFKVK